MFDAEGAVKIVDFGIARLTETTTTGPTTGNVIIGSPPYLSPEQFQGRPADARSDLYALGCVLTTLLTGRPPFQGEHPLAYGHQHVSADPPPISERRPGVDPALEALVQRLLSKDPEDRPQSALDVFISSASPTRYSRLRWPTKWTPLPHRLHRRLHRRRLHRRLGRRLRSCRKVRPPLAEASSAVEGGPRRFDGWW